MKASEFNVKHWVDAEGNKTDEVKLSDYQGLYKVIFCFQSWCPGCHSIGFPSLQRISNAFDNNDKIAFIAIQTVFEGFAENSYEKMKEMQQQYDLKIPFGHDAGDDEHSTSNFMTNYQTNGTPWFVLIDPNDEIIFSNFHVDADKAITYLKEALDQMNN